MNNKIEYVKLLTEFTKVQLQYFEADSADKLCKSQKDFIKENLKFIGDKIQEIEKELEL